MISMPTKYDPNAAVIVISIGNSSTALARWHEDQITGQVFTRTGDEARFEEAFCALSTSMPDGLVPAATVISSVVPAELKRIRPCVEDRSDRAALVVGERFDWPIETEVEDRSKVGMDRLACAVAAFDRLQRSCVVVDFGTAVTVDLVNDEGFFLGGAILPGLMMQLSGLHEGTALLPLVPPGFPDNLVGKNTTQAIQSGVCRGLAGAVRGLVEAYATQLHHWPQVVATGGDAVFMAPHCDFLDSVVADLALRGVGIAYKKYMQAMGA